MAVNSTRSYAIHEQSSGDFSVQRGAAVENAENPPVFLVGAQRSGSTLLRVMLDSHPEICFARHGEIETGLRFMERTAEVPSDLSSYYAELNVNYEFRESGIDIDESLPLDQLMRNFWHQGVEEEGKPVHIGTVHKSFSQIPKVWPEAQFIYLYRDGRDVARSHVRNGWERNFWSGINPWIQSEQAWSEMKTWLAPDSYIEVQYEELVRYPRVALMAICDFLRIPYCNEVFDYTNGTNFKAPDPKRMNQWQRDVPDREIQAAETRAGDFLVARGYALSGLPALDVSGRMRAGFARRGVWKQRLLRIKRFGATPLLLGALARQFGLEGLKSRSALAMSKKRKQASG